MQILWFYLAAATLWQGANGVKPQARRVHVVYPVSLLAPITGTSLSSNVTRDRLVCFGNRDYSEPTYVETLACMLAMLPYVSELLMMTRNQQEQQLSPCSGIWGSRSVVVDAVGSVEFLKVGRLPAESNFLDESIALNATRWLEMPSSYPHKPQREVKQIPAEPIYLCARSSDWMGSDAHFRINFRPVYIRERDKTQCMKKSLLHVAFLLAVSSIWLLPYLAALVVAVVTFTLGFNKFIMFLGFSCCFVCMAPLMLTKKNRHLASLYFKYFFTRIQAEETRMVIQQRLPVFQALFFSSAVMCVGSAGSYIIYSYFGVDRETRNTLLKITMGISASWFVFFVCRSFERFFRDWLWLAMSVALAQLLDNHLNPLCRDEVMVVTITISFLLKKSFPRILKASRVHRLLSTLSPLYDLMWQVRTTTKLEESGAGIGFDDTFGQMETSRQEEEEEEEEGEGEEDGWVEEEDEEEGENGEGEERAAINDQCGREEFEGDLQGGKGLLTRSSSSASVSVANRRMLEEELGGGGDGDLYPSRMSHDSHDSHRCALLDVGDLSVALFVLGPLVVDSRRIYFPLATSDLTLLQLAERGCLLLSNPGLVVTREYAPLAGCRRVVAHASFVTTAAALGFKQWSQKQGLEVLRSLANSSATAHPGCVELLSISPRVCGHNVALYFKFAPIAYPDRASVGRSIHCVQCVLVAIREQFSSAILSIEIDTKTMVMAPEYLPNICLEATITASSLAGAGLSIGLDRLLSAHKACQRLHSSERNAGFVVSESRRAVMSAISAMLCAIGFENHYTFEAANFEVEISNCGGRKATETADADAGAGTGADDEEESFSTDADCSALTLFLSVPLLFNSRCFSSSLRKEDTSEGASLPDVPSANTASKCLRMLLGDRPHEDASQNVNRDLSSSVSAVIAATYIGWLLRFEASVYFRAQRESLG